MTEIPLVFEREQRRMYVGGQPLVFHCHHYNTFLQRTVQDAQDVDSEPFLVGAAAECAFGQLSQVFAEDQIEGAEARKALASELYRWAGFGTLDLAPLGPEGGSTETTNSHYGMGWRVKWGSPGAPVDHFTRGWLAGALAAIYDQPQGHYRSHQEACASAGEGQPSRFRLEVGAANYRVFPGAGAGEVKLQDPLPIPESPVDYEGILSAVSGLDLSGDEQGIASAFGVYLTRHYANYYNRVSFEFARELVERFGDAGREVAEPLLIEAGHVCAFNTFGGIMTSSEWDALIKPTLTCREDWVHGMVAVANALGWGRWQVTQLDAESAEFAIHNDYESLGYEAMYGQATHPVSYLAQGGTSGIMNLVYLGEIEQKPDLTEAFYQRLFSGEGVFRSTALSSRAMGDPLTRFRVTREGA